VGTSVFGIVAVAGRVAVGVSVGVAVSTVSNVPSGALARSEKNAMDAAIMTTTARMPTAAGKLSVTTGMRLACTDFSTFFVAFGSGLAVNSVPHTRQRVAFSLKRVPQVGQIFVLLELVSRLIRQKLYLDFYFETCRADWLSLNPNSFQMFREEFFHAFPRIL
jgi:hypothetical protein